MALLWLMMMSLWCVAEAPIPFGFGPCPTPPVQDNFQVDQYTGTWYEFERFPVPFEALVKCGQANYQLINTTAISVNNSGIREFKIAGRTLYRKRTNAQGIATIPDPSVPAKLVVQFGNTAFSQFARGNYWVLATDYDSYSLVYSCTMLPLGLSHYETAWILTRVRGQAPDNLEQLKQLLRDNDINPNNFFVVDQSDCDI